MSDSRRVVRSCEWPFSGNQFPVALGAVVQETVTSGQEPVRLVVHDTENGWAVGDGRNDPNLPGACAVRHLRHVVEQDPSVAALAQTLPPGHRASREDAGDPWVITNHAYEE